MGQTTLKYKLPYPESSDNADVPKDIKALAESVEGQFDNFDTKKADASVVNEIKKSSEEIRSLANLGIKDVTYNPINGVMTFIANDDSQIDIDLPLELLIESGTYDSNSKTIILVLANEDRIEISISDLISDIYSKDEANAVFEKKHNYYTMTMTEEVEAESEVEIPCNYIVGADNIDIFCEGEYLKCEKNADDIANWREVGEKGSISNKVQFGFNLEVGDTFTFIVKGGANEDEQN